MNNEQKVAITLAHYKDGKLLRRQTFSTNVLKLGQSAQSHVRIEDPGVARMHAVIEAHSADEVTLLDLGAGTEVNGAPVSKHRVRPGDAISIGASRIVVEAVGPGLDERIAQAQPWEPAAEPRAAAFPALRPLMREGSYEYRVVPAAPPLGADEQDTDEATLEVRVSWGRNVLAVSHVHGSYWVGEDEADFHVPASVLGCARAPLCLAGRAVLLPGAHGSVTFPGRQALGVEQAIAAGGTEPCAALEGARTLHLPEGAVVRMELGNVLFEMRGVRAARKAAAAAPFRFLASATAAWVLASLVGHAGMLAATALLVPPLGDTADDMPNDDQRHFILQHMDEQATREPEAYQNPEESDKPRPGDVGEAGRRAVGEEGKAGSMVSTNDSGRFAIQGDPENMDPKMARARAIQEAREFGILSMLSGSEKGPIADWADEAAFGKDALSADGNMWGAEIGEAHGANGLGLTGIGEGGGGRGHGMGLTNIGTIGGGFGTLGAGGAGGIGRGSGRFGGRHQAKAPTLRVGEVDVGGRLPPEVIQRIVRSNFGRYRACYETGLRNNPNLAGRVVVSFVVDRNGIVTQASGGGDLPDGGVVSCIVRAFYALSFPSPDGIVTVSYPISLTPTM
jgi:hypothetical protein